jgi:hypothetical protein
VEGREAEGGRRKTREAKNIIEKKRKNEIGGEKSCHQ